MTSSLLSSNNRWSTNDLYKYIGIILLTLQQSTMPLMFFCNVKKAVIDDPVETAKYLNTHPPPDMCSRSNLQPAEQPILHCTVQSRVHNLLCSLPNENSDHSPDAAPGFEETIVRCPVVRFGSTCSWCGQCPNTVPASSRRCWFGAKPKFGIFDGFDYVFYFSFCWSIHGKILKQSSVDVWMQNVRLGPAKLRAVDFAERHGYIRGVIKQIVHDPGRGTPLAIVEFRDLYKHRMKKETIVAAEELHTGQFIYCGKKAQVMAAFMRIRVPVAMSKPLAWCWGYFDRKEEVNSNENRVFVGYCKFAMSVMWHILATWKGT
uniref:Ribosomal Proteins L2 RNA binding domain-containing protein n=1 Tax=Ditylenchus dipsaci TaxID=166011 RepID=A0A915E3H2_9BILA